MNDLGEFRVPSADLGQKMGRRVPFVEARLALKMELILAELIRQLLNAKLFSHR
jgi:hypothetical protein